ncbi:MAG: hypothetical protein ACREEW_16585, partial [Caulobacteraceae bacterium]
AEPIRPYLMAKRNPSRKGFLSKRASPHFQHKSATIEPRPELGSLKQKPFDAQYWSSASLRQP